MPILREKNRADTIAAVELYKKALTGTCLSTNDEILIENAYMGEWDTCEEFVKEHENAAIAEANEVPDQYQQYIMLEDDISKMIYESYEYTLIKLADSLFDLKEIFDINYVKSLSFPFKRLYHLVLDIKHCKAEYF